MALNSEKLGQVRRNLLIEFKHDFLKLVLFVYWPIILNKSVKLAYFDEHNFILFAFLILIEYLVIHK